MKHPLPKRNDDNARQTEPVYQPTKLTLMRLHVLAHHAHRRKTLAAHRALRTQRPLQVRLLVLDELAEEQKVLGAHRAPEAQRRPDAVPLALVLEQRVAPPVAALALVAAECRFVVGAAALGAHDLQALQWLKFTGRRRGRRRRFVARIGAVVAALVGQSIVVVVCSGASSSSGGRIRGRRPVGGRLQGARRRDAFV